MSGLGVEGVKSNFESMLEQLALPYGSLVCYQRRELRH